MTAPGQLGQSLPSTSDSSPGLSLLPSEATARAYEFAKTRYLWPSMRKDIITYCRSCRLCQVVKTDNAKKPGNLNPIATPPPLQTICIDVVGALPISRRCDSLATVTEKFTKAVILIPCKKTPTAEEFAKLFFKRVYPMWGVPQRMIIGRDRRFVSSFWKTLMELAGTRVALATAYHPQSDGQSERTNRTIEAMIRILTLEAPQIGWVDFLPTIELTHNSTPHTASGNSPYELLYIAKPKTFGECLCCRWHTPITL